MNTFRELLIVIVLLTCLSFLAVAAVLRGSTAWKEDVCRKNLSEIYRMASMYSERNDGALMPLVERTQPRWTFWYSYIIRYTDDPSFFYCPANKKTGEFFEKVRDPLEPVNFDEVAQSYGLNYHLYPKDSWMKTADVANPAYVIYFGDSNTNYLRATPHCWLEDYAPRHEDKSNFVFMDGHMEKIGRDALGVTQQFGDWKKDLDRWKAKLK